MQSYLVERIAQLVLPFPSVILFTIVRLIPGHNQSRPFAALREMALAR